MTVIELHTVGQPGRMLINIANVNCVYPSHTGLTSYVEFINGELVEVLHKYEQILASFHDYYIVNKASTPPVSLASQGG